MADHDAMQKRSISLLFSEFVMIAKINLVSATRIRNKASVSLFQLQAEHVVSIKLT